MMELTNERRTILACLQAKSFVRQHMNDYLRYVAQTFRSEAFNKVVMALLPFDNSANARLRFMDDTSCIKSMGVSLMRMELEPEKYSLGVSIELLSKVMDFGCSEPGGDNMTTDLIAFVSAGHSMTELKEWIKSDDFSERVSLQFEELIDGVFYSSIMMPEHTI